MNEPVIEFEHIYKKFARGEQHNTLRDLIPAVAKRVLSLGRGPADKTALKGQEFWAVQDVSFRLGRGQSMGIIGPNGSGKSTSLKLLSGILRPERGRFAVRGRLSALIEVGAGFHPDLTGRENVFLNGAILGMTRREISAKFNDIVEFAGVEEFIDTPVKRYSSGMQVRLGFAVAAFIEPDVLLVDEVLSVGDTEFRNRCQGRMNRLLKNGVTMILVSHNLSEVRSLCQSCLMLYKGQAVMHGDTAKVIEEYHRTVAEKVKVEQDKQAVRQRSDYRDSPVTLTRVQLFNERGEVAEEFGSGQSMTVRIHYHARHPLAKPQFAVELLWATDDYVASVFSTRHEGVDLAPIDGTGWIDLRIGGLLIEPNIYAWNVLISDGATNTVLDAIPKVRWVLNELLPIPGIFGLQHDWGRPQAAPVAVVV